MAAEIGQAWRRLVSTGGQLQIAHLADETGWSTRDLSRRFRAEIGLSPKAAARVIRFDRARRLLQRQALRGVRSSLADLAVRCGYYDQAHLAREFGDLAGASPSVWIGEELRNVQGVPDVPVPDFDHG